MARAAVPISLSLNPEDRDRFERLVERFGGGNRSEFLRAAMDRLETAEIAAELRELRAYGQQRLRELHGDAEIDIVEVTRRILNPRRPRTATAARRTRR